MNADSNRFVSRAALRSDLERLGLRPGDVVMAHGALSRVGRMLNGPDIVIGALLDATSAGGTVLAYTDWDARYDELLDADGRVPTEWREHVPAYDPATSRSTRDNGALPEFLRTWPGARRSQNPGASVAAVGERADWITRDHPLDYGYGPGSPLARLVEADGKVVMIGAPRDTMTLLHHAEHLAVLPHKRVIRYTVPLATPAGTRWRWVEEFDTSVPVSPVLDSFETDPFELIVDAFLAAGSGSTGLVGQAPSLLVEAREIVDFAVTWLERQVPAPRAATSPAPTSSPVQ